MYNGLVQVFAVPSLCLYFEGKDASYLEYHPLFHLTRFHCLSRIPHLLPSSPCHGRFNKQKYTYLCLTCLTGDFLVYCEVHHRQSKTRRKRQIPCRERRYSSNSMPRAPLLVSRSPQSTRKRRLFLFTPAPAKMVVRTSISIRTSHPRLWPRTEPLVRWNSMFESDNCLVDTGSRTDSGSGSKGFQTMHNGYR